MTLQLDAVALPLAVDQSGMIRVSGTRITLELILGYYNQGQSAEQIHEGYPSIPLADVHAVIAFYLRHKAEVEAYLTERAQATDALRKETESDPANLALRAKILERARQRGLRP